MAPMQPTGVLADDPREYLAIASKDMFFGKMKDVPKPPEPEAEEDHSPFVTLVSVVGEDDGTIVAVFRDKLDNHNYTITQNPKGAIAVKGEWEVRNRWMTIPGYSTTKPGRILFYGTADGENRREWRVRRVLLDGVILEKMEEPDEDAKPKLHPLAGIGGGLGALVAVPEGGKVFRVGVGQDLETDPKDLKDQRRSAPPPSRYLLTREAWKAIYAPLVVPTASEGEVGRGK